MAKSLADHLVETVNAIGVDFKALSQSVGTLAELPTTAKTSLVAAIAEIHTALASAVGVSINDAAGDGSTTVTWSADKIYDTIEAAKTAIKNELTNGAAAALDTLNELGAALGNDPNYAATVATELSNRLRFDAAQSLTSAQKTQGCTNLGIGEPDTDLLSIYNTAKA